MRLAVLIIALCLTMIIGVQSCTIAAGGSLLDDQSTASAGAMGVLLAFLFVVAAALVWGFPRASGTIFLVGGGLAMLVGLASIYHDLAIWGGVSIVLGIMAFAGARELRRRDRQIMQVPIVNHYAPVLYHTGEPPLIPGPQPVLLPPPPPRLPTRSRWMPTLIVMVILGIVVGVFASGLMRLDQFVLSGDAKPVASDSASASASYNPLAETASTTSSQMSSAPTSLADVATQDAPPKHEVTKAWLLGTWGPLSNDIADRGNECDNDGTVTFSASNEYSDGEGRGKFVTDGRSITYFDRIPVDLAEDAEDRSQFDRPTTSQVEAVDANTMRESGALFVRCSSLRGS